MTYRIALAAVFLAVVWPALAETLTGAATVIDGDTLALEDGTRIRLFGIDAPEHDQSGGSQASAALNAMVKGQVLNCRVQGTDVYRRTIAICRNAQGFDLSRSMVRQGLAWAYLKYSTRYELEERSAACGRLGLWSDGVLPPWDFRHCHE